MELDTGCGATVMGLSHFNRIGRGIKLQRTDMRIREYSGREVPVKGTAVVTVRYGAQQKSLRLVVTEGNGPPLLGRNWLKFLQLDWKTVFEPFRQTECHKAEPEPQLSPAAKKLIGEYPSVFETVLGKWRGEPAKLRVTADASPKFYKARNVPFSLQPKLDEVFEKLVKLDIIESVNHSDWAAPIVPVRKPDGSIRVCGDFKVTVNPYLIVDQHPLPTANEVFVNVAGSSGCQEFSTLDMSQAFLQIPIDEDSQKLVVINTHKGLFKYKRLPFGVAPATAILQKRMEALLAGIPNTAVRVDDIIVSGRDRKAHEANLRSVLDRFQEAGLTLNPAKCKLFQSSVTYLSHVIDKNGIRPSEGNTKFILEAPEPKNLSELESFIGMVTYYADYIPNRATIMEPLNQLRRKGQPLVWSSECKQAYQKLKEIINSSNVRVHCDPKLPLILQCDASPYGLGAVLSHQYANGKERPILFASRSLTPAERNYSQIDREALAIIFAVTKCHQYVYGRKFTLRSDHKPLLYLFGPKSGIPNVASSRLQRWAVKLQAYDYDLEHVPGTENGNADALSRLPVPYEWDSFAAFCEPNECTCRNLNIDETDHSCPLETLHQVEELEPVKAFDSTAVASATTSDTDLKQVLKWIINGSPQKLPRKHEHLKPYFMHRADVSTESGCILLGHKVVIPPQLRPGVLGRLHEGHPGATRMKMLVRSKVWWPMIDAQIETAVKQCTGCAQVRNQPPTTTKHSQWPPCQEPWERVHLDFAGPMNNKMYLVLVDAESNWIEMASMPKATTQGVINFLRTVFTHMGLRKTIVTDNGTQFTSYAFKEFCAKNGIKHVCTAPYHPASNGEVERQVQEVKKKLRAMSGEDGGETLRIQRFLLAFRVTPNPRTGKSPSQVLMNRQLRTCLDQLRPRKKEEQQLGTYGRELTPGPAWVLNQPGRYPKWVRGRIVKRVSRWIYEININGGTYRKHVDHLREYHGPEPDQRQELDYGYPGYQGPPQEQQQPQEPPQNLPPPRRYPDRNRRPVDRMGL